MTSRWGARSHFFHVPPAARNSAMKALPAAKDASFATSAGVRPPEPCNSVCRIEASIGGPPEPRDPSRGKTFYSLRTPRSVFANMSTEQIQTLGNRRGLRIRVDPE
jgi:hypothetical protein